MGRDKPKKYNKMGYFEKQRYYEEQGDKYNINRDDFENSQGGGGGRYEDFDDDGFRKAVKNAQRNDYDYRTSASHMDGIKGDGSSKDFINYQRGAQKLHKKAGNGGEYSSNKDITGVTNNLVKDYRRGLQDQITAAGSSADDEQTATTITPDEPYEPSEELVKAREVVQAWESGETNVSPYGGKGSPSSDAYGAASSAVQSGGVSTNVDEFASKVANRDNNKKGAQAFADDYLADFKQAVPMVRQF